MCTKKYEVLICGKSYPGLAFLAPGEKGKMARNGEGVVLFMPPSRTLTVSVTIRRGVSIASLVEQKDEEPLTWLRR